MPSTRPEQVFDAGACDACRSTARKRDGIDWGERRREFEEILSRYRSDGSSWDCIIPVSGGKDSCYQALTMRDKYDMNPLCVNFVPCEMTPVGLDNLTVLRDFGFDMVQFGPNRRVFRQLSKIGFTKLGDCCWAEHIGIFTIPVIVACKFNVPLLVWGENSQFEYGGPASKRENNYLDRNWLEQFQMLGYRLTDTVHDGIAADDLKGMTYPSDEEVRRVGVTGLFLGYFEPWDTHGHVEQMLRLGWNANPDGPVEGAYNAYENLDCKWIGGLHDYMKFLKFGYGRATDQLCIEIRAGRLTRDEAIDRLSESGEGLVPRKYVPDYLDFIGITEEEFFETLESFTNKMLFECNPDGSLNKDGNGNVRRKFFPKKA